MELQKRATNENIDLLVVMIEVQEKIRNPVPELDDNYDEVHLKLYNKYKKNGATYTGIRHAISFASSSLNALRWSNNMKKI